MELKNLVFELLVFFFENLNGSKILLATYLQTVPLHLDLMQLLDQRFALVLGSLVIASHLQLPVF